MNEDDARREHGDAEAEPEPDFLDVMDAWDEIDPYDDEEPFVPFFDREWVKIVAVVVAVSMFGLAAYQGLRVVFSWP